MRKVGLALVLLVAVALAILGLAIDVVRVDARADLPEAGFSHAEYGTVLAAVVDGAGRVDYRTLRGQRGSLERYLAQLAKASPATTPDRFDTEAAALAYYLNAYNAFVLYGVTERPGLESVQQERVDFFVLTRYVIGGQPTSLYDLENEVIRPFGDPRVHFALSCASKGCPELAQAPFRADRLDAQLDREARAFCADPRQVRVDDDEVKVSQIFQWYAEDFPRGPVAFCRGHGREDLPEAAKIGYLPYDWGLNAQPGAR